MCYENAKKQFRIGELANILKKICYNDSGKKNSILMHIVSEGGQRFTKKMIWKNLKNKNSSMKKKGFTIAGAKNN